MPRKKTTDTTHRSLLTDRELYVLRLAAGGLTDKEIAQRAGIGIATVRTYWERLREKLQAVNRAHAIALGMPGRTVETVPTKLYASAVRQIEDEAIFICARDHTFMTWNKGVAALFGYSEAEWIGKNADLIFVAEEKHDAPIEFSDADAKGSSFNDRWHLRKDGSRFWGTNIVIPFEPPHVDGSYVKLVRPKAPPTGEL